MVLVQLAHVPEAEPLEKEQPSERFRSRNVVYTTSEAYYAI